MSALLIDTNAYAAHFRGDARITALFEQAELLVFPFVVVAELLSGFKLGSREAENRKSLFALLDSSDTSILYPDDETSEYYASIFAELRSKGLPIPTNDLWIAALALQRNLPLCTLDKHFSMIGDLLIV
ncbi:MAG: type II toxin-antitoxin system VapC family toxin [Bacteroidota bacterium]|nr:type II toxin-antitoxin system VapC family toxin [Bacteroidota bacterium]MDP4233992.1 type II toxin-antitoxin system VapC family toxin [Bacteroidota bacterium]MDP4242859.1 type II toxin-antitoxin system VapC family toxin [Bacteroidota bacterium]MDP4287703.1 type II toxin-antitoxin system VapC family toxin [Bacteroidota bacterium]